MGFKGKLVVSLIKPVSSSSTLFLFLPADRKAFYVIFTWESGAQIYELVAQSVGERKM